MEHFNSSSICQPQTQTVYQEDEVWGLKFIVVVFCFVLFIDLFFNWADCLLCQKKLAEVKSGHRKSFCHDRRVGIESAGSSTKASLKFKQIPLSSDKFYL